MKRKIIFVLLISVGFINGKPSQNMDFVISIDVNAPKSKALATLRDFAKYPEWNSILRMEENDGLVVGEDFQVTILMDGETDTFSAELIEVAENSFSARQRIGGSWIFSATHHFVVEPIGEGKSRLVQSWEMSGVLYTLFKSDIFEVLDYFKVMNTEFKKRVEASQ